MPLMNFLAAATDVADKKLSLMDALIYSGLGIAIVFAVLIVLMAFIWLMSKVMGTGKSKEKASTKEVKAPVQQTVAPAAPAAPVAAAPVPDGAMFVTLNGTKHTVSVTEKLPRFTVKVNGKAHSVDVESAEEAE